MKKKQVYAPPVKHAEVEVPFVEQAQVQNIAAVHDAVAQLLETLSPFVADLRPVERELSEMLVDIVSPDWPVSRPDQMMRIRDVLGSAQFRLWRSGASVQQIRDYLGGQEAYLEKMADSERLAGRARIADTAKRD